MVHHVPPSLVPDEGCTVTISGAFARSKTNPSLLNPKCSSSLTSTDRVLAGRCDGKMHDTVVLVIFDPRTITSEPNLHHRSFTAGVVPTMTLSAPSSLTLDG
eukprot:2985038-Rhodomonas_salina.1